jgi:hypothetical protein
MREIFNITEREGTHPVATLAITEPQPGRIDINVSSDVTDDGYTVTLDRAEALAMARTIIQKLDMVILQPLGSDVLLVPATRIEWAETAPGAVHKVIENDIVKVKP